VEFLVLGPIAVLDGKGPVHPGGTTPRRLLTALVLRPNEVVSSDQLVEILWGDQLPADPMATLHAHVSRLRRVLEPDRAAGGTNGVLVTRPPGYLLRVSSDQLDASRFEGLLDAARSRMELGEPAVALDLLVEALDLCRGDAVADFASEDFARGEAMRLDELRRLATEEHVEARLRLGEHAALVGELEASVRAEPLRERTRAQLMLALHRSSRQAEALRTYEVYRAALADELGLDPSMDLQRLETKILRQDPEIDWVSWSTIEIGDGSGSDPANALGNLFPSRTSFVGRDHELATIGRALTHARLLTLTGTGGVGKSRLAHQAAAEARPGYANGAWLCELAAASDAASMLEILAATLGVVARAGTPMTESICQYLRAKRLLLVLDNCEHLLDDVARLATQITRECLMVRILATSRERLSTEEERVLVVPSLALPAADTFEAINASDAVRLFCDRAARVDPAFDLDSATAAAVAEVCRRLDGIPLAIELAAARIEVSSPSDVARSLDESLPAVAGRRSRTSSRHATLWATLDWSYARLESSARVVFDRLGVFSGSFDASAAQAVTAGRSAQALDVVDALTSLVNASMLEQTSAPTGTARYQMLEVMRAFARSHLDDAGEAEAWCRRHAEHCAGVAEDIGPRLDGPDELSERVALRANLDNFRSAVSWALNAPSDTDAALAVRIIAALAPNGLRHQQDGITEWAERAAPRAGVSTPARRTAVLAAAAWNAYAHGDLELSWCRATEALSAGLPSHCNVSCYPYLLLTTKYALNAELDGLFEFFAEAHRAIDMHGARRLDHLLLLVASSHYRAAFGQSEHAHTDAAHALRLARQVANPSALAGALWIYAFSGWRETPRDALTALEESVALMRAGASDSALARALALLGFLRARRGDRDGSLRALREGIIRGSDIGDRPQVVSTLDRAAASLLLLGEPELALVIGGFLSGPLGQLSDVPHPDRDERDHALKRASTRLGLELANADRVRGASMSHDEIVELTHNELGRLLASSLAA
jgi:predicted ATPase/DNA-binding SARP family transcriptional activator